MNCIYLHQRIFYMPTLKRLSKYILFRKLFFFLEQPNSWQLYGAVMGKWLCVDEIV